MLIIIEGVDGSGKSTLAGCLAREHLNWLHRQGRSAPEYRITAMAKRQPIEGADPFQEYELDLFQSPMGDAATVQHLVILDRWAVGEAVYGPLYRDRSRLTDAGMLHVELVLDAMGAAKIILRPSEELIRERLGARGEDFLQLSDLHDVYNYYVNHAHRHAWQILTSLEDVAGVHAELITSLTTQASLSRKVAHLTGGTYAGSLAPKVILCGDRRNAKPDASLQTRFPFTPTVRASSGEYLLNAILLADAQNEVGLLNTEDVPDIQPVWEALGYPCLIGLGNNSFNRLSAQGLPCLRIPHPQWVRRFRYHDQRGYAELIRKACDGDNGRLRFGGVSSPAG